MLVAVLSGFVFAVVWLLLGKLVLARLPWLPALLPAVLFCYFVSCLPAIQAGAVIENYPWVPSMGINFELRLDGLSLLFALLITGIGAAVFLYASYYLKANRYLNRFFAFLTVFMASMLGLVLSDNLLLILVFWEITSISSYFLIGFDNESATSRNNALRALAITGAGGFLLMAGFIMMGSIAGSFSMSTLLAGGGSVLKEHPLYGWMVVFLFAGAFTKSAQYPFHFWLPGAMVAPTPVSAYLHSATMVKAGIFLLARFTPVMGHTPLWNYTLLIVGAFTMLYGAAKAIQRSDLKEILAYSTIAALGILVVLLGIGTPQAMSAMIAFVLAHALYKASLFMVAGALDHATGTRDVRLLAGLRKCMWPVAAAGILAALSGAGVPLTFGFISKDLVYEASLHAADWGTWITGALVLTNILVAYAGYQAGIRPFSGTPARELSQAIPKTNIRLWMPPLILALLGVAYGLFPWLTDHPLIAPAVAAMGGTGTAPLAIWHGWTPVLALSAVTLLASMLLYFSRKPGRSFFPAVWQRMSPETASARAGDSLLQVSHLYTNLLHSGYLRSYVSITIIFITCLLGLKLVTGVQLVFDIKTNISAIHLDDVVVFVIILAAIWKSISTRSRITAVASLGVVGYGLCLLFVLYSAPDLAMTQFTIDTLTVVLFVFVLFRLPRFLKLSDPGTRWRDGTIAALFGLLIAVIALEVMNEPTTKETSRFYAENAYLLAGGKNVVNVMLVDFRGLDTMVEITVLTIAALGVYSLMKLRISSNTKE